MKIAISISTLDRPDGLERILGSLAAQRVDGVRPDLVAVVVNNDPADDRPTEVANRVGAETGLVVEVHAEPKRGVAPPRNRGLRRAAEIAGPDGLVGFVDDDEETPDGWLAELLPLRPRRSDAPRRDVIFLVDGSGSMAARRGEVSAFVRARQEIERVLAQVPEHVDVTLLRCGGDLRRRYGAAARALSDLGPPAGDLDVDLSGRRCVVTGANAGIGRAAALELADLGAEVVLVCRNAERGEEAANDLRQRTGNPNVSVECADLSDLASVRALGDRIGLAPPLVISEAEIGTMMDRLDAAISETADWLARDGLAAAE